MKINITAPVNYTHRKLIKKTELFMDNNCDKKMKKKVFEGKDKGYYAWIKQKGLQIEVIDKSERNMKEIENYLNSMFCHLYIGISYENAENTRIKLKDVECFEV